MTFEAGIFGEGDRVELTGGEVEKMNRISEVTDGLIVPVDDAPGE